MLCVQFTGPCGFNVPRDLARARTSRSDSAAQESISAVFKRKFLALGGNRGQAGCPASFSAPASLGGGFAGLGEGNFGPAKLAIEIGIVLLVGKLPAIVARGAVSPAGFEQRGAKGISFRFRAVCAKRANRYVGCWNQRLRMIRSAGKRGALHLSRSKLRILPKGSFWGVCRNLHFPGADHRHWRQSPKHATSDPIFPTIPCAVDSCFACRADRGSIHPSWRTFYRFIYSRISLSRRQRRRRH